MTKTGFRLECSTVLGVIVVAVGLPSALGSETGLAAVPTGGNLSGKLWILATTDFLDGVTDEAQQAQRVYEIADRLIAAADAAEGAGQFEARLAAANWILMLGIEPMATRYLLGVPASEDGAEALAMVRRAKEQLDQASQLWAQLKSGDAYEADRRPWASGNLEGLAAFAEAFEALWRSDYQDDDTRDAALSDAAEAMLFAIEDERPPVADSAKLWQACIYAARGKLNRAIDLLPAAASELSERQRIGFFARILRCRCTAQLLGSSEVAIALLARMEERALSWFAEAERGKQAQRAAALVRRQLMEQWAETLRAQGLEDRAVWCERSMGEIDHEFFDPLEPMGVLRLRFTLPDMVDIERFLNPQPTSDSVGEQALTSNGTPSTQPDEIHADTENSKGRKSDADGDDAEDVQPEGNEPPAPKHPFEDD